MQIRWSKPSTVSTGSHRPHCQHANQEQGAQTDDPDGQSPICKWRSEKMTVIISSPTPSPSTLGLGLVWVRCPASGARTQPGPCVVWRVRPTPAVNFLPCFDLILEVLHFLSAKSDQIRINVVDALGWGWGGGGRWGCRFFLFWGSG